MATDISANEMIMNVYRRERELVNRLVANAEHRATELQKQAKSVRAACDLAVAYRDDLLARQAALNADIDNEFGTLD